MAIDESQPTLTVTRIKREPCVVLYTSRSKRPILITTAEATRLARLLQNAVDGKPGHHGKVSVAYGDPID